MAATPKRRISSLRRGKRRAAIKLKLPNLGRCPKCGAKKLPHISCSNCQKN